MMELYAPSPVGRDCVPVEHKICFRYRNVLVVFFVVAVVVLMITCYFEIPKRRSEVQGHERMQNLSFCNSLAQNNNQNMFSARSLYFWSCAAR